MKRLCQTMALLFLSMALSVSYARFLPGRVITHNGDTLIGFVQSDFKTVCRYKQYKNSEAVTYTPDKIYAIELENGNRKFVSGRLPYNFRALFFEVLAEGKLNLLYLAKGDSANFFVQRKGKTAIHSMPYERLQRYVDNGYIRQLKVIETTYHIDTLKMVMNDCPALYAEIEKMNAPVRGNLIRLVNNYNSGQPVIPPSQQASKAIVPVTDKPELLRSGKINLYMSKNPMSGKSFFIQKGTATPLIELPFTRNENKLYKGMLIRSYTDYSTNHIDTLKKYMADASPVFEFADMMKIPTKRKLQKVVDEYNSYIDEPTYIRKHNIRRLPFNIDVTPGFYFAIIDSKNPLIKFGGIVNIGFFKANQHLFVRSGLFLYKVSPWGENYSTYGLYGKDKALSAYKIPLQLEYRFKENTIQPCLSLGYNYYHSSEIVENEDKSLRYSTIKKKLLPAIFTGINIQMTKRCSTRAGVECEFRGVEETSYPKELGTSDKKEGTYLPKELYQASLFIGIQIKL